MGAYIRGGSHGYLNTVYASGLCGNDAGARIRWLMSRSLALL